jgi:hypothetical protein
MSAPRQVFPLCRCSSYTQHMRSVAISVAVFASWGVRVRVNNTRGRIREGGGGCSWSQRGTCGGGGGGGGIFLERLGVKLSRLCRG